MAVIFEKSHREFRVFIADASGVQHILPVIVTEHGVLDQFARYIHLNRRKSRSWQDSATFAVQLLLEYIDANKGFYDDARELFSTFADALHSGTVSKGVDPSGLWWKPRQPRDSSIVIHHITRFSGWLARLNGDTELQLNPWQQASRHEERLNWAAHVHRRDNAFLSHLWRTKPHANLSRSVRPKSVPVQTHTPTKSFPEDRFDLLISEGFRRRARDNSGPNDLRNILICYLMHYGGLRLSEALSLWTTDVSIEAGELAVRVYHPQYGLAPSGKTNRATYLERQFGLLPRNRRFSR